MRVKGHLGFYKHTASVILNMGASILVPAPRSLQCAQFDILPMTHFNLKSS
jgi:hypothetical protein